MMKKIFAITIGLLFFCNFAFSASKYYGNGELKFSDNLVKYYMKYLKGTHTKTPSIFLVGSVSPGRNYAMYYFCSVGHNCQMTAATEKIKECERRAKKKMKKEIKCYIFDIKRTIRWDNGINPGKGKESKINSKWNEQKIFAKLTELGFYGENSSNKSEIKKNNEVKKKSSDSSLSMSDEIKKLNELYKDGTLTKEEFEAAKKKLLN